MPYFITDKSADCSGWATIKEDGEVIGCHTTKQAATEQMVAVSMAEKMEPGGERIASGPLAVIVDIDGTLIDGNGLIQKTYDYIDDMKDTEIFIVTGRNESDRETTIAQLDELGVDYDRLFMNPGSTADTPEFKKATAEKLLQEYNIIIAIDNNPANRKVYRDLGITALDVSDVPETIKQDHSEDEEDRAINKKPPAYMRAAARRGLEYYAEGKAGDGLTQKTVREARLMARGIVTDDKWIRIAAWIARHLDDLDSPDANPNSKNYPSNGVVAHLLWGSGPSKTKARAAMKYALDVAEKVKEEQRHLPGKHDQSSHGKGGGGTPGMGNIEITEGMANDFKGGSAAPHLRQAPDGSYSFTPERQALHDSIVEEALSGVPTSSNPTMVVLGGGAASGKSTALSKSGIDINSKHAVINPDDVKAKIPEYKTTTPKKAAAFTHEESSYVSKRIQAAAFERKVDVVADGVGDTSSASMSKKIDAAKGAGYRVTGAYVSVPTDVAITRADARGAKSGRYVPHDVIRAGHVGVSNTFPKIMDKFDSVQLFDNTTTLKLIGSGKNGTFKVEDQDLWDSFLAKGSE